MSDLTCYASSFVGCHLELVVAKADGDSIPRLANHWYVVQLYLLEIHVAHGLAVISSLCPLE